MRRPRLRPPPPAAGGGVSGGRGDPAPASRYSGAPGCWKALAAGMAAGAHQGRCRTRSSPVGSGGAPCRVWRGAAVVLRTKSLPVGFRVQLCFASLAGEQRVDHASATSEPMANANSGGRPETRNALGSRVPSSADSAKACGSGGPSHSPNLSISQAASSAPASRAPPCAPAACRPGSRRRPPAPARLPRPPGRTGRCRRTPAQAVAVGVPLLLDHHALRRLPELVPHPPGSQAHQGVGGQDERPRRTAAGQTTGGRPALTRPDIRDPAAA